MRYILFLSAMLFSVASFSQTSWLYPAANGEIYNTWNDPTNAYADDGTRTTLIYSSMPGSQDYYNFSIPDMTGNTITGIEVRGELYHNNISGTTLCQIEISGNDGSTWTSSGYSARTASLWTEEAFSVGGQYSLWGTIWEASNLTNANFKVRLTFVNDDGSYYSELDYVQVRVYYSGGGSPTPNDTLYFDPTAVGSTQAGTVANPIFSGTTLETAIEGADPGTVFMLADTTYYGFLSITGASGSALSRVKLTTWNKYTTSGKFKLSGYKTLSGFTQVGNNWRLTDTDLPNDYKANGGDYNLNYILKRNFLRINGVNYAVSRFPNTGYRVAESYDNSSPYTYIYDNEALDNNYDGAMLTLAYEEWGIWNTLVDVSGNTIGFQSDYNSSESYSPAYYSGRTLAYALSNLEYLNDANGDHAYNPNTQQLSVYWTGDLNTETVEYSTIDYLLRMDNCAYIDIDGISFDGGVIAQVYSNGGNDNRILHNEFINSPGFAGVISTYTDDISVVGNTFTDGVGMGVYTNGGDNPSVDSNTIARFGVSDVMMPDRVDGPSCGIHSRDDTGDQSFNNNIVDSIAYGGIVVRPATGTTSIRINENVVRDCMLNLSDGGSIYVFEGVDRGNFTKEVRKNYVHTSTGNSGLSYYQAPAAFGIYLDGGADYWNVDSNVVIRANAGINLNGTDNNDIAYNVLYNNTTRDDRSSGFKSQYYGHYSPTTDCYFHHNTIIVRDSTTEHGVFWIWDGSSFNNYGTISNYNDFFTPFVTSTEHIGGTYNWSTTTPRSRAGMYSVLGWENNSTWNKNNHDYQDVSGISRDDFTKIFFNASSSVHYFKIGTASFRDVSTNTVVIDSFAVDPYEYKALFYNDGSLSGIDDELYLGATAASSPSTPDPGTPTYSASDSLGINFTDATFLKDDWNNITDPTQATTTALNYFGGASSGISMLSEDIWSFGVGENGYYPGIFPDSVQRTNFIAGDADWRDFVFTGLQENKYYTFYVLGSRINNGDTRRVEYQIGGESIIVQITDNDSTLAVFDYVQPVSGTITLSCRRNLGDWVYINGIKIVEYVLPAQATARKINNRVIFIRYF